MSSALHTEKAFEDRVEVELVEHGWEEASPGFFRADLGLDTAALVEFIGRTQQQAWDRLVEISGS